MGETVGQVPAVKQKRLPMLVKVGRFVFDTKHLSSKTANMSSLSTRSATPFSDTSIEVNERLATAAQGQSQPADQPKERQTVPSAPGEAIAPIVSGQLADDSLEHPLASLLSRTIAHATSRPSTPHEPVEYSWLHESEFSIDFFLVAKLSGVKELDRGAVSRFLTSY